MLSTLSQPQTWTWKGFPICYYTQGNTGPAVILVHGFGASWGHWRKNIPELAVSCRVFALDLLGFGGSAKPTPGADIA
ncbi:MAG: alpha/beta fold hydrolase, partial [Cyanobacteriota bacterium]|nr:alpha/beta fold hydrolase [Cyanobacteriota bacterium]